MPSPLVAVVMPCYRVRDHVLDVIAGIGPECGRIYVVDDGCPEHSGRHVQEHGHDPRVEVVFHDRNRGVGAAVMTGYRLAAAAGATVIVKLDGDGQMNPGLLPKFVRPILAGMADYTKGNRFFRIEDVKPMPTVRLLGNAGLSFLTKLSSGYWNLFDPTNGYTAIHAALVPLLPLERISPRYFFESDMLFFLNIMGAKVKDIPMAAVYGAEKSGLMPRKIVWEFFRKNMLNFARRIFYNYFLRDFTLASVLLVTGALLLGFGTVFGAAEWIAHVSEGTDAPIGTVMLAALPVILGLQLLLSFIAYDMSSVPRETLHATLDTYRPEAPPPG